MLGLERCQLFTGRSHNGESEEKSMKKLTKGNQIALLQLIDGMSLDNVVVMSLKFANKTFKAKSKDEYEYLYQASRFLTDYLHDAWSSELVDKNDEVTSNEDYDMKVILLDVISRKNNMLDGLLSVDDLMLFADNYLQLSKNIVFKPSIRDSFFKICNMYISCASYLFKHNLNR